MNGKGKIPSYLKGKSKILSVDWNRALLEIDSCRIADDALAQSYLRFDEMGHAAPVLPHAVRFSTNGLVLDGGLVVLSHPSHGQALCLVIGLPLGISRSGVYRGDPSGPLSSSLCLPSDA